MIRAFFKDSLIYTAPTVLSRMIGFLLFPLFTHVLTPTDYGVADLLTIAAILMNLTVALEIAQGLGRYYSMTKDAGLRRDYASSALWFSIGAYTLFAAVTLALAEPIASDFLNGEAGASVVRLAVAWMWLFGILYLLQEQLRWQLRPKPYAITSFVNVVITAAASVLLVLVLDDGVAGLFAAQLVGALCAATVTLAYLRGTYYAGIDRQRLREMLAYSLPLVPASIGVFLSGFVDRLAIKAQLGLSDVGIYGASYRVATAVGVVMIGFQGALTPLVLSRHDAPETPIELAHIFRYFVGISIAVFVVVSVFADAIFTVIAPNSYAEGAKLVPLLVLSAFFAGMYIFAPGMAIAARTRPVAVVSVVAGLANAALAFALVALVGIAGAAVATLATAVVAFAALMIISQRLYPVPHDWRSLGFAAAAAIAAVSANHLLTIDGPVDGGLGELAVKLACVAVGGGLVAALLVRPEDLVAARTLRRAASSALRTGPTLGPLADSAGAADLEERVMHETGGHDLDASDRDASS